MLRTTSLLLMFSSISVFQTFLLALSQLWNIGNAFPLQRFKGRIKLFGACNRQLNLSFPFSALRISCAFLFIDLTCISPFHRLLVY